MKKFEPALYLGCSNPDETSTVKIGNRIGTQIKERKVEHLNIITRAKPAPDSSVASDPRRIRSPEVRLRFQQM